LALLLRGLFLVDAVSVNQVRGLPFRIADLAASIGAVMDGTHVPAAVGSAGAFGSLPYPWMAPGANGKQGR
jgi:2-oxoglutarate ferredoxin oxidoreductase subunit alpha